MLTIRDALTLSSLGSAKVAAGSRGLDREIAWFHVIDIPQIIPWIKRGHFLLTATYSFFMVPETTKGLIKSLNDKGVVGIIMALGLYLKDVPGHMIDDANELGFPIITVTADNHLEDITRQLAEHILNGSEGFSKYDTWFHKIVEATAQDESLGKLTRIASEVTEASVLLLDNYGRALMADDLFKHLDMDGFFKHFREKEQNRSLNHTGLPQEGAYKNRTYFYYQIKGQNAEDIAFLLILDNINRIEFFKLILLQNIIVAMSVLITGKELHNTILSSHIPLFEDILYGRYVSRESAQHKAANMGWNVNANHVVVIIEPENYCQYIVEHQLTESQILKLQNKITAKISEQISAMQGKYPVSKQDSHFITIFELTKKLSLKKLAGKLEELVDNFSNDLSIHLLVGISSIVNDLSYFSTRINEAQECLKIIKELKNTRVAKYDELSMELVLYKVIQNSEIKHIYIKKIQKIIDNDLEFNSNLMPTLNAYVNNQANLALTARYLSVHRHTVKNRINKIGELLEMDICTTGALVTLTFLLKINEHTGHDKQEY
ncbi:MAG: hypothetical protein VR67_18880 [Peptococcaceae bacterium BRH_c8a]|nr:MAG: hypothetical protein VR67_18880 [Peptococcaceae bacterium BRH_c8a]